MLNDQDYDIEPDCTSLTQECYALDLNLDMFDDAEKL